MVILAKGGGQKTKPIQSQSPGIGALVSGTISIGFRLVVAAFCPENMRKTGVLGGQS